MMDASANYLAVIKVVGVGGGGTNAVNRMVDAGLRGVEFIAVNTDAQALQMCDADVKIHIGSKITRGPRRRRQPDDRLSGRRWRARTSSATPSRAPTWCSSRRARAAAPVPAPRRSSPSWPRSSAPSPSAWSRGPSPSRASAARGRRRTASRASREKVDTLIIIPNDRLLQVVERRTSVIEAFKVADDVLRQGVQGITDLITVPGLINLDFADVRTIMKDAGSALMGIGVSGGENRAVEAARAAISSPLLEASVEGARGILLNITGGSDLGPLRDQRGRRDHLERRRQRLQHHLRRGHRPVAGRRGARHRHRHRLRSATRRASQPAPGGAARGARAARHAAVRRREQALVRRGRRRPRHPELPARPLSVETRSGHSEAAGGGVAPPPQVRLPSSA